MLFWLFWLLEVKNKLLFDLNYLLICQGRRRVPFLTCGWPHETRHQCWLKLRFQLQLWLLGQSRRYGRAADSAVSILQTTLGGGIEAFRRALKDKGRNLNLLAYIDSSIRIDMLEEVFLDLSKCLCEQRNLPFDPDLATLLMHWTPYFWARIRKFLYT